MIVFSEAGASPRTFMEQQIARLTAEAQQNDIKVVHIPESFEFTNAFDALCWCPIAFDETYGFVIGYIPSEKRYQEIYDAALQHNIRLINSPEESNRIMDFEHFYPLIADLTPESWIIKSEKDLEKDFEFPVFVKGAIKSRKEDGWSACVAYDKTELKQKCNQFFAWDYSARNKAIVRKVISLKYDMKTAAGFPMGREFRVMLHNHKVIDYGSYWQLHGKLDTLTSEEEKEVKALAEEASRRIGTPLAVIDIGQDINDKWWVIEAGDPQFCAVTHISGHVFWQHLKGIVK